MYARRSRVADPLATLTTRKPPPYALDRWKLSSIRRRLLHITAPPRQGTGSRRDSLHPSRRQGAVRPLRPRLRAQPAHRTTLRAPCGTRVDCLLSRLPPRPASLRVVEALRIDARGGKRSSRHRSGTCKTLLLATLMHPRQAMRVKVRPELPGNFPLRGNLSRNFRSFPLDPRCRGGARMASQATAHGGGRKNGAHPPSESLG